MISFFVFSRSPFTVTRASSTLSRTIFVNAIRRSVVSGGKKIRSPESSVETEIPRFAALIAFSISLPFAFSQGTILSVRASSLAIVATCCTAKCAPYDSMKIPSRIALDARPVWIAESSLLKCSATSPIFFLNPEKSYVICAIV